MSQAEVSIETLRKIPLLQYLNDEECRQVKEAATTQRFQTGEDVLQQGGRCQNLWIVLEGECEVIKLIGEGPRPKKIVLASLGPYDNFGEMSFFHTAPHSAAVRACSKLKLFRITREAYDQLIESGVGAAFKLAYNTVVTLAQRLRRMDEWVARLLSENGKENRVGDWKGFREKLFQEWNL